MQREEFAAFPAPPQNLVCWCFDLLSITGGWREHWWRYVQSSLLYTKLKQIHQLCRQLH